ncbi:MAG TPA: pyridoxal-dependent decarboxylase, exosortase A system-associated [Aquabacterium sp.]|nr:pyridoxal-dependent decarboxylase, exosortase A system-associated [Aquabacterium sp.]HEX5354569.1 pyridoxal-dependent decarboxylase, exosortase A system-associated [Aquabacterium sp.]
MRYFADALAELTVGGVPLLRLAARVGSTPFYAYDRAAMAARVAELRAALPAALRISYAMKANPMPAVVQHMAGLVDGLDVASAGEMMVALDAGMDARHISFAGPGKTEAELHRAVAAGILLNVESFRELPILQAASRELGLPARVAVRVNPDFDLKSSGMKMGGGPKPFGVDAEVVPELLAAIGQAQLAFEGFHIYAGSQNLNAAAVVEAQCKSYELAVRLAQCAPAPVRHLNLGGGFGIPYFPGDKHLDLAPIGANLAELIERAGTDLPEAQLSIELGRYLVGEAGVYVCRVLDRKVSRGLTYLVTDGGLHHHLAASGNFGQVIRKNYPVRLGKASDVATVDMEAVSVVGPLCTPLDLLGDRCRLPHAEPGDLVAIMQSGAYGASASPQRFLGHPEVREVLV